MAKKSTKKVKSTRGRKRENKFGLGIALIVLGAIFILGSFGLAKKVPSDSFASEPVKVEGFSLSEAPQDKIPSRIIIPSLLIDLEVKPARNISGYWEVFLDSAAWGEGSGLPGEAGNQVIYAHARKSLFLPLRQIEVGTKVYVFTKEAWYAYEVKEIKEVRPTELQVIAPTRDETLTLYTCSGFSDSKRLIVVAKPVN
jgi:sortase A